MTAFFCRTKRSESTPPFNMNSADLSPPGSSAPPLTLKTEAPSEGIKDPNEAADIISQLQKYQPFPPHQNLAPSISLQQGSSSPRKVEIQSQMEFPQAQLQALEQQMAEQSEDKSAASSSSSVTYSA